MMVFDTTGMPYSKAKAKAFGKGPGRRRAIIMRENVARRTLIHANSQYGPFRPTDIYEDSQEDDDYEPTGSVAPAASDAPTAAPVGNGYLPPLVIGRALDVLLNAPGSTREAYQSYFNSRTLGPGRS